MQTRLDFNLSGRVAYEASLASETLLFEVKSRNGWTICVSQFGATVPAEGQGVNRVARCAAVKVGLMQ